jgi:hypothetical protein
MKNISTKLLNPIRNVSYAMEGSRRWLHLMLHEKSKFPQLIKERLEVSFLVGSDILLNGRLPGFDGGHLLCHG